MYCICCKRNNVKPDKQKNDSGVVPSEEELLWKREVNRNSKITTIDNELVNDGIIQIISAGYGSKNDGDQFIIAICDDCIRTNLEDGTLLYWGNYMGFSDLEKEDIDKSKKIYRRRKNLDELT